MDDVERKINHPIHYNRGIETTDYICSWDMDFCEGNVVKYVTRWKDKDGVDALVERFQSIIGTTYDS